MENVNITSDRNQINKKIYIGDGVYAQFELDTDSIILTTENGIETTNRIVLEFEVWNALQEFIKHLDIL